VTYGDFNLDLPTLDEALHTPVDAGSVVHPPVKGKPPGPSKKGKAAPKKKGHAASGHTDSSLSRIQI